MSTTLQGISNQGDMADMTHAQHSLETVRAWLIEYFARHVRCPEQDIDPARTFSDYHFNSVSLAGLGVDIEDHFDVVLDATELWDHPSIDILSILLSRKLSTASDEAPDRVN
ncbi:acyl carrier protein [Streptomyces sp. G5(2025)]|uniref:acyl carrier protein n=1 Tax=Streptomyces sp. G5(2025) TaxID=3406628 RepID=UPI003C26B0E0